MSITTTRLSASRKIPMSEISKAYALAKIAHEGQVYGHKPYFLNHVCKVAMRVKADPNSNPTAVVVAYLHDVVEDTMVTLDDLRSFDFAMDVVDSIDVLTHRRGEQYQAYIQRIIHDGWLTAMVKYHDLMENYTNTVIALEQGAHAPVRQHMEQRLRKYVKAIDALNRVDPSFKRVVGLEEAS